MNGFINVCKPCGLTASDVVVKIRGIYGEKTGHLGTLDPGATGVLPVAIGKGAKLFNFLIKKTKTYRAFFTFGISTDTLDSYGRVIDKNNNLPSAESVKASVKEFVGEIYQTPPQYSAKSVNGVRAYKLARNGETVEIPPKKVRIEKFELVRQTEENTFVFDISCGAGTYIRSLARDLAEKLNTTAYMSGLIRLSSGCFFIENSVTLDEINADKSEKYILPLDFPLQNVEKIQFDESYRKRLLNGVKFDYPNFDGLKRVYCGDDFFGLANCLDNRLTLEYNLLV